MIQRFDTYVLGAAHLSLQSTFVALGTHAAYNRSRRATRSCEHITAQSAAQHTVMGARTRTREMRGDDPNVDAVRCRGGRKMPLEPRRNAQGGAWCTVLLCTRGFAVYIGLHRNATRCELVRCSQRGYRRTNDSLAVTGGGRKRSSHATALPLCAAGVQLTARSDVSISQVHFSSLSPTRLQQASPVLQLSRPPER